MSNFRRESFLGSGAFHAERARKRKVDIGTLINAVLRKEMDLIKELCG